jgi:hypothetical protein
MIRLHEWNDVSADLVDSFHALASGPRVGVDGAEQESRPLPPVWRSHPPRARRRRWKALLIMLNLPFALTGGTLALWLWGSNFHTSRPGWGTSRCSG